MEKTSSTVVDKYEYSGKIYGGDEFVYNSKYINGLQYEDNTDITLSSTKPEVIYEWTYLRPAILLQHNMVINIYSVQSIGFLVAINGKTSIGLGLIFNSTAVKAAPVIWDPYTSKYLILSNETIVSVHSFTTGQYRIVTKFGYNEGINALSVIMKTPDNQIIRATKLIKLVFESITHSVVYLNNSDMGSIVVDSFLVMSGDYIYSKIDPNEYQRGFIQYVLEINGTDAWNSLVYYNVSDGSPLDHSEYTHVIMLVDLPYVYPLNAKLVVYVICYGTETILTPPTVPYDVSFNYPTFEQRPPVISEPDVGDAYGIFSLALYLIVFMVCTKMGVPVIRVLIVSSSIMLVLSTLLNHSLVIVISAIIFTFSISYEIYTRWKTYEYQ